MDLHATRLQAGIWWVLACSTIETVGIACRIYPLVTARACPARIAAAYRAWWLWNMWCEWTSPILVTVVMTQILLSIVNGTVLSPILICTPETHNISIHAAVAGHKKDIWGDYLKNVLRHGDLTVWLTDYAYDNKKRYISYLTYESNHKIQCDSSPSFHKNINNTWNVIKIIRL